jgi:non-specific serine/threonine protein kinase
MKLIETCHCGAAKKLQYEESRFASLERRQGIEGKIKLKFRTYVCGHGEWISIDLVALKQVQSLDGLKQARPFQIEGIKFLVDNDANGLLADAMTLGKTVQALLATRARPDLLPILIVVPSATTFQWIRETYTWRDSSQLAIFPILGSQGIIPAGFHAYLISMDTLGRNGTWKKLLPLGIKLVIVDEIHKFKDPSSSRTIALLKFLQAAEIKHKILLSGTPIKNRASEYFVALNILDPNLFQSQAIFQRDWLSNDGKRLNEYRIDRFREAIKPYVLRREKKDVYPDLPPLTKNFQFVNIDDPLIKNSYNREIDLMSNLMLSKMTSLQILGWLVKMRRITGIAKVPMATEYIEEFLENTDEKIAIGIQHVSVRDTLYFALQKYKPLKLSGEDSAYRKFQLVQDFQKFEHRVMIINEIAGGTGVDGLQKSGCSNILALERQWNIADETQFEDRFDRDGRPNPEVPVIADYMIAHGTVDEWFHDKVESTRKIFGETIQGWQFTNDATSLREVAEKTVRNKL